MGLFDPQLGAPSPVLGGQPKTGRAEAITQVGKLALQAYEGKAVADLRTKLNEIASYRQTGKSSTWAQARVNAAVSESINRLPASADLFRQEAATMFGTFGTAQGMLDQTEEEKLNASIVSSRARAMAEVNLDYTNAWDRQLFSDISDAKRNAEIAAIENQATSRSSAQKKIVTHRAFVQETTAQAGLMLNNVIKLFAQNSTIDNTEEVLGNIRVVKQDILTRTITNNPEVDPVELQKSIDSTFKYVEDTVVGLATGAVTAANLKRVQDTIELYGVSTMPKVAVLNRVGGQAAVERGLALLDPAMPPEQRALLEQALIATGNLSKEEAALIHTDPSIVLQAAMSKYDQLSRGTRLNQNDLLGNSLAQDYIRQVDKTPDKPLSPQEQAVLDGSVESIKANYPENLPTNYVKKDIAGWARMARVKLQVAYTELYSLLQDNPNVQVSYDNISGTFSISNKGKRKRRAPSELPDLSIFTDILWGPPKQIKATVDFLNTMVGKARNDGTMEQIEQHINQIRFMVTTGTLGGPLNSKGEVTPVAPENKKVIRVNEQGDPIE